MRLTKSKMRAMAVMLSCSVILTNVSPMFASAKAKAGKVTVTKSISVMKSKTKKIKVKGTGIKKKSFKSMNKKIATVSKTGKVKGKKAGKCKIKVTVKFKSGKKVKTKKFTVKVTVKGAKIGTPISTSPTASAISAFPTKQPIRFDVTTGPVVSNTPSTYPTTEPTVIPTEMPTVVPTETPAPTPSDGGLNYDEDGVVVKDGVLVSADTKSSKIVIPTGTKSIGKRAFYQCASVEEFEIPDTVQSVDDEAFAYCTSIEELTFPTSVSQVGNEVVKGCAKLKRFTIKNPNCVIGRSIFAECPSIEESNLPTSSKDCVHEWFETGRVIKDPTCIETGLGVYVCKNCGDHEQVKINALGHVESKDTITDTAATCSVEGSAHTYCTVCGATMNVVHTPKLAHEFEKKIIKKPTCTADGFEGYVCKNCGDIENTTPLEAYGHDYEWVADVFDGYGDGVIGRYAKICARCDEVAESYDMRQAVLDIAQDKGENAVKLRGLAITDDSFCDYHGNRPVFIVQSIENQYTGFEFALKKAYAGFENGIGSEFKYKLIYTRDNETLLKNANDCGVNIYWDSEYFDFDEDEDGNAKWLGNPIDVID